MITHVHVSWQLNRIDSSHRIKPTENLTNPNEDLSSVAVGHWTQQEKKSG